VLRQNDPPNNPDVPHPDDANPSCRSR
jgi:hypothetical protein